MKKILTEWTIPEEPIKRKITEEEKNKLYSLYGKSHSWSNVVDAKNRIILGGGECEGGRFYVNPEDLK